MAKPSGRDNQRGRGPHRIRFSGVAFQAQIEFRAAAATLRRSILFGEGTDGDRIHHGGDGGGSRAASSVTVTAGSKLVSAVQACQQIKEDAARLACYDRSVAALTSASERGDVSIVDREQMRAARRSLFGFSIPGLPFFSGSKDKERAGGAEAARLDDRLVPKHRQRLRAVHDRRAAIDVGIDRGDRRLRREDGRQGHDRPWRARQLFHGDRPQSRVPRASNPLGLPSRLLGLQAGFSVDIRLLPLDAPVAKLVQRNARAGDRANHVVAVGEQPERARQIMDSGGSAASCISISRLLLRLVEQARLGRDVGSPGLALNRAARLRPSSTPTSTLAVAKAKRQQPRLARVARASQSRAVAAGDPSKAFRQRPFGMRELGHLPQPRPAARQARAMRWSSSSRAEPPGNEVEIAARRARTRRERPREPFADLVEPLPHGREDRLRLRPAADGQVEPLAAALGPPRQAMLRPMRRARQAGRAARPRTGTAISAAAVGVGARQVGGIVDQRGVGLVARPRRSAGSAIRRRRAPPLPR